MGMCFLCDPPALIPDGDALAHFERVHPTLGVSRWPDGKPVVIDRTLEPEDFENPE